MTTSGLPEDHIFNGCCVTDNANLFVRCFSNLTIDNGSRDVATSCLLVENSRRKLQIPVLRERRYMFKGTRGKYNFFYSITFYK